VKNQVLTLKPNDRTLKIDLKSIFDINFELEDSIGKMLGFSNKKYKSNILHCSDLPVNIRNVNSVRINCNITTGAYHGNLPSHSIYEFTPNVQPGWPINIVPANHIYLSINSEKHINNIIELIDQQSRPVNF